MVFRISKLVEIVIILGKTAIYFPLKCLFSCKNAILLLSLHCPHKFTKKPIYSISYRNLASNIVIMVA